MSCGGGGSGGGETDAGETDAGETDAGELADASATCTDGAKNGTETDVDCGGGACGACAVGGSCSVAGDCQSGICDPQTAVCLAVTCGDGVVSPGEGCDDGNDTDDDACSNACVPLTCGDGTMDDGEACDDGNRATEACAYGETSCEVCAANCTLQAGATSYCGDSSTDAENAETCDDGNTLTEICAYGETSCEVCAFDCVLQAGVVSYCGDGTTDATNGEGCDDTNSATEVCAYGETSCQVCAGDCTTQPGATSYCGDGAIDAANGEECDDTSPDDLDACSNACHAATCSDGVQNDQETDTDCGGGTCAGCGPGLVCEHPGDCAEGLFCEAGLCAAPRDCAELLLREPGTPSGVYAIDPDGVGSDAAFDAYCEMTTGRGGWTRIIATWGPNEDYGQTTAEIVSSFAAANAIPGVYRAFGGVRDFNQVMLRKISGNNNVGEFAIYDLVEVVRGRSVLDILQNDCRLAQCLSSDDSAHDGARVTRTIASDPRGAWTSAFSGRRSAGTLPMRNPANVSVSPDYFFMCGVNESSDNDQSVLAFADASGDVNTWGDYWRGQFQRGALWSFWNADYSLCPATSHIGGSFVQGFAGYKGVGTDWEAVHAGGYEVYVRLAELAPFDPAHFPAGYTDTEYWGNLARDLNGDLLIPTATRTILSLSRSTGAISTLHSDVSVCSTLSVVAHEATNSLFVGDSCGDIYRIDRATGTRTPAYGGAGAAITQLVVGHAGFGAFGGQILFADHAGNAIRAMHPTTFAVTPVATLSTFALDLEFHADGRLFAVINTNDGSVVQVAANGTVTPVASMGTHSDGIAVDSAGDRVFVISPDADQIYAIDLETGNDAPYVASLPETNSGWYPTGLVYDGAGFVYKYMASNQRRIAYTAAP